MGVNPQDLTTDQLPDDVDGNLRPTGNTPVTAGAHEVSAAAPAAPVVPVAGPNPPAANPPAGNSPQGAPGRVTTAVTGVGTRVQTTVRVAPIRDSRVGDSSGAGLAGGAGGPLARGGTPLLDAILGFEKSPAHQAETGLAGLVGLTLLLAAFQFGKVALRRRRKTVPVVSNDQNTEGGEQL
jgi:hypothetical protein